MYARASSPGLGVLMMNLFKSKEEKELDAIIQHIEINMQNNYKDNAQAAFAELMAAFENMINKGEISEKTIVRYKSLIDEYTVKLQGYSHKDQKPYWT